MFLKVIACEVAFREICACAARSVNQIDLDFLSQGYHDNPEVGICRIQDRIDAVEPGRYDAVLVGYGLCNTMLSGLRAPAHTRLVVARAHDCITFFLGSRERYGEFFRQNSGTYYFTAGWLEHRMRGGERPQRNQAIGLGSQFNYEELVERHGEENARYLMGVMEGWSSHYTHGMFIDFDFSTHLPHKEEARIICEERGWQYGEIAGDLTLLQRWLDADWLTEDFLMVPPGELIRPSYDDSIIQIEPAPANEGGMPEKPGHKDCIGTRNGCGG